MACEVGLGEQRELGGLERGAEALLVDLTVAGDADAEQFPLAAGLAGLDHDVLQGVGGGDRAAEVGALAQSTSVAMVGVSGVSYTLASGSPSNGSALGHRGLDGLDVRGVTGLEAAHVGVLADLALGEELLRRAAAHRARRRRDDDVLDAEPCRRSRW